MSNVLGTLNVHKKARVLELKNLFMQLQQVVMEFDNFPIVNLKK